MSFPAEILATGIGIADSLTKGVQGTCTLEAWTASDGRGARTYAAPVTFRAVVDTTRKEVIRNGKEVIIVATVVIVGDLAPNGAAGRVEPVDPRDRITLPDGTTGTILSSPGAPINPLTGRAFVQLIELGPA